MTEQTARMRTRSTAAGRVPALAGGVVWIAALVAVRPGLLDLAWARALLVLAPLVLVPLGLDLVAGPGADGQRGGFGKFAGWILLPAAMILGVAQMLPPGGFAASLALPWLGATALLAWDGVRRAWRRGVRPLHETCIDAALVYLAVGGAWALSDRMGYRPLGFDPVIVLLTAVHFHYAGFVLPLLTALAMRHAAGRGASVAGLGVVAGVPLVAAGITATQLGLGSIIECLAAWLLALAGILAAGLQVRLVAQPRWPPLVRSLWAVSALSLTASVTLAALYGSRFLWPLPFLDIPLMRASHGTFNAIGFALAGVSAWVIAGEEDRG